MLETLYHLKDRPDRNNSAVNHIELEFEYFGNKVKQMSGVDKNEWKKTLIIVNKILDFNFNKLKQQGQGLKTLTPNQMLTRLLISLK